MRLFHGTTGEAYKGIMADGFRHKDTVWTCSNPKGLYFYRQDRVAEEFDLDERGSIDKCFELALTAGSCAAALANSSSHNLFVFEFQLEDSQECIVMPDTSTGESVEYCAYVQSEDLDVLPNNVYLAASHYSPMLAPHILCGLRNRDHLAIPSLTDLEIQVMENAIEPHLDAFQSTLFDFYGSADVVLIHEGICAADTLLHNPDTLSMHRY